MKKYIRFKTEENAHILYGVLEDTTVTELVKEPWEEIIETSNKYDVSTVKLLTPVTPSKIICVGLNYHAHVKASYSADEAPENPLLFLKPSSALIGDGDKIIHPSIFAFLQLIRDRTCGDAKNWNSAE